MTKVLLVLLALVGLGAGGLYIYRAAVAQAAIEGLLADLGLDDVRLTVEEIAWDHARLTALAAGRRGELEIAALTARYRMPLVLSGQVDELRVEGLGLKLDLSGESPVLGSLQAPLETLAPAGDDAGADTGDAPAGPPPLPRVQVESGRIEALTVLGPVYVDLEGEIAPRAGGSAELDVGLAISATQGLLNGRLTAEVSPGRGVTGALEVEGGAIALGDAALRAALQPGRLAFAWSDAGFERLEGALGADTLSFAETDLGRAALSFDFQGTGLTAAGRFGDEELGYALQVETKIANYPHEPWMELRVTGEASAAAPPWRLLPEPRPAAGQVSFDLAARGAVPADPPSASGPGDLYAWLAAGDLTAELNLGLQGVELPDLAARLDVALPLSAELKERVLQLSLMGAAGAALAGPSPALLAAAGLPAELLGEELQVSILDESGSPFSARLSDRGSGRLLELRGGVLASAPGRAEMSAIGDVDIGLDRSFGFTRAQLDDVILTATSPALPGTPLTGFRMKGKLTGDLTRVSAEDNGVAGELPKSGPGEGYGLEHKLLFVASDLRLQMDRQDKPPLGLKSRVARVRLDGATAPDGSYSGALAVEGGRLDLPELALAIEGLSAQAPLGPSAGDGIALRFGAAAVSDTSEPPRFHPVRIAGTLAPHAESLDLAATVTGANRTGRVNITARQVTGQDRGSLRAALVPLTFKPGGTQPAALSPLLESLAKVSGQVEAKAEVAWRDGAVTASALVDLQDLDFEVEGVKVAGLRGTLELDQLMPLSSPPGQLLTARSIDPGLPLTDLSARFRLLPAESPRALLEEAEFSAAGGRYRLGETLIDPAQRDQRIELEVVDLELARLFETADIEGLSGTGSVRGVVPIVVEPEGVAIAKARLRAQSPGVLRFESEAASRALATGGEPVELMLRALKDFHYEKLSLSASKAADGEARLRLRMLGQNPDVLEGHPFRFNINLTGNLDPILNAIAKGRNISNDLLSRTWRLQR